MEITRSLKEKMFVMFLDRELTLQRNLGNAPNMDHAVSTAEGCTVHAVETMIKHGHPNYDHDPLRERKA